MPAVERLDNNVPRRILIVTRVFSDGQDGTTRVLLLRIPAGTSIIESIPLSSIYIISRSRSPPKYLARAVTTCKFDREEDWHK